MAKYDSSSVRFDATLYCREHLTPDKEPLKFFDLNHSAKTCMHGLGDVRIPLVECNQTNNFLSGHVCKWFPVCIRKGAWNISSLQVRPESHEDAKRQGMYPEDNFLWKTTCWNLHGLVVSDIWDTYSFATAASCYRVKHPIVASWSAYL